MRDQVAQLGAASEIRPVLGAPGGPPQIMGIGSSEAIPAASGLVGLGLNQMEWIELNEAVCRAIAGGNRGLGLDPAKMNPLGGASALGHLLGETVGNTGCDSRACVAVQATEVRDVDDVRMYGDRRGGGV